MRFDARGFGVSKQFGVDDVCCVVLTDVSFQGRQGPQSGCREELGRRAGRTMMSPFACVLPLASDGLGWNVNDHVKVFVCSVCFALMATLFDGCL